MMADINVKGAMLLPEHHAKHPAFANNGVNPYPFFVLRKAMSPQESAPWGYFPLALASINKKS